MMDRGIWINGEVKSWQDAHIHPFNFSLMYGYGVFEGIRVYQTSKGRMVFRLEDHLVRLLKSCKILNIKNYYTLDDLTYACHQLMDEIKGDDIYLRPMIICNSDGFLGIKAPKITIELIIAAIPWNYSPSDEDRLKGLSVKCSDTIKPLPNAALLGAKSIGNYLSVVTALTREKEIDDLIFFDQWGYVAEASGANVFVVKNNQLLTPYTNACLKGITRDTVFSLCSEFNLVTKEQNLTKDDLYTADEIFLSGTAIEIMPITNVDNTKINCVTTESISQGIYERYRELVRGNNRKYKDWLKAI